LQAEFGESATLTQLIGPDGVSLPIGVLIADLELFHALFYPFKTDWAGVAGAQASEWYGAHRLSKMLKEVDYDRHILIQPYAHPLFFQQLHILEELL
jgi:hypothetical protein